MIQHNTNVRVRYGEVDRMGFFYHSHYVELFDIGRTELMRNIGLSNYEIESSGIELPVCKVNVDYKMPALYDDVLTVVTKLSEMPRATIRFDYEVYRTPSGSDKMIEESIATGSVTLAFMHKDSKKACRPSSKILEAVRPYFK